MESRHAVATTCILSGVGVGKRTYSRSSDLPPSDKESSMGEYRYRMFPSQQWRPMTLWERFRMWLRRLTRR